MKAVIFGGIFQVSYTPRDRAYRNEKTRDIEISEDEPVDFTRFSLATSRFLSFAAWNLAEFCTLEQLGEEMSTDQRLWFKEVFQATFFFFGVVLKLTLCKVCSRYPKDPKTPQ